MYKKVLESGSIGTVLACLTCMMDWVQYLAPAVMTHTCNPSLWEVDTGGSEV